MSNQQLSPISSYIASSIATLSAVRRKLAVTASTLKHQKTSKITDLPYELILITIGSLDERSIACMVQTCQYFRSLLEPILYRHIQVFRSHAEASSDPLKSYLLHRTLLKRPDILSFVLSYHGPLVPDIGALQSVIQDTPMLRGLLPLGARRGQQPYMRVPTFDGSLEISKTIFRGTVNLQDLHFADEITDGTIGVLDSLKNIEKLALNIGGYSSFLLPALRTQPRLKHLELLRGGSGDLFQRTDFPELRSLKATLLEATEIVPGRPIETLELLDYWAYKYYDQSRTEDLFRDLARSACDITDFKTRVSRPWDHEITKNSLRLIAQYLPRIERLCISLRQAVSDSLFLEVLPAFGSLRHLELIGTVSRKEKYATVLDETQQLRDGTLVYCPEDFGHFVWRLKEHCRDLVEVEWCRMETFHCRAEGEVPFTYRALE